MILSVFIKEQLIFRFLFLLKLLNRDERFQCIIQSTVNSIILSKAHLKRGSVFSSNREPGHLSPTHNFNKSLPINNDFSSTMRRRR